MKTIAIVGTGLIGASFGLALRGAGFGGDIIGVSSDGALAAALERGAISGSATLEEAVRAADLVYLAQTVDRILEIIPKLAPLVPAECIITDAGSTKLKIVECAERFLGTGRFVGGHPIAGKERSGAAAADGDLFRDRPYILTPVRPVPEKLREILRLIGARVVEMTAEQHDATLALTSHLPQLISTALAATLAEQSGDAVKEIFGQGLMDMTRLALSTPELWASILETNEAAVSEAVGEFIQVLSGLQRAISKGKLNYTFEKASAYAREIRKLPN